MKRNVIQPQEREILPFATTLMSPEGVVPGGKWDRYTPALNELTWHLNRPKRFIVSQHLPPPLSERKLSLTHAQEMTSVKQQTQTSQVFFSSRNAESNFPLWVLFGRRVENIKVLQDLIDTGAGEISHFFSMFFSVAAVLYVSSAQECSLSPRNGTDAVRSAAASAVGVSI